MKEAGIQYDQLIHGLPLFEGVPEDEIRWLLEHGQVEVIRDGEYFHREGEPVEKFYIVLNGELQVTRHIDGSEIVIGTTPVGIMGGELALLQGGTSIVSARAIEPSSLLILGTRAFREIFSACPVLSTRIFEIAAERLHMLANDQQQREKLAALGKLSAGLAHELNNPSSAANRAAQSLKEALPLLQQESIRLGRLDLEDDQLDLVLSIQATCLPSGASVKLLLPIEQSEREDEIGSWLEALEIPDAWEMAANLVNAGITATDLEELNNITSAEEMKEVLAWLNRSLYVTVLLDEVQESTNRISELVGAVKSYTFMDQAPVQEVDLHKGLENTLMVMRHKLRNVDVQRQYDPEMPLVQARGSELNQVWTNLIDNAVDAMEGKGRLTIITRCENDFAMVEIADNGPGIPPEVRSHLFEPFYTTKGAGFGTGLGLDISRRIIQQHKGSIEVQSSPGNTRFIIRIPVKSPGRGKDQP